jgi:protein phosphatase
MNIQIASPLALHERGQRPDNEDNLFPAIGNATPESRLFLVCDGVGGADKGEIASAVVCRAIPHYFSQNRITVSNEKVINDAVGYAESELKRHAEQHPETITMATTLTLLHLHEAGATVAHIGDSRIYHIRNGHIQWQTQDHSFVNELVKSGIISSEEARQHPKRNVITRALQGNKDRVEAAIHWIEDIQEGDYFFLCTDGILEAMEESELIRILGSQQEDTQKIAQIQKECQRKSRDNYTAFLVCIQSVAHPDVQLIPTEEEPEETPLEKKGLSSKQWIWALTLVNLLLFTAIIYFFYWNNQPKEPPKDKPKAETQAVQPTPEDKKNKFDSYEAQKIKKEKKKK